MLASLDGQHPLGAAVGVHALEPQHDLLGGLGLLAEDGLGLASVAALLAIIAPLALGVQGLPSCTG